MRLFLIALVRGYRYVLSPWWGGQCRFTPSCSCFAIEALEAHGSLVGGCLAIRRILSCHPWHLGGVDPVPTARFRWFGQGKFRS